MQALAELLLPLSVDLSRAFLLEDTGTLRQKCWFRDDSKAIL
jgi:hypothetical protein